MTNKINDIDVSKYFIEVVDEGGSTINYKILPNSEKLLVEKIFEQNQQLKRLQEENEELKSRNANLRLNLATYDLPEVKKVLTDWRTGELDKKFKKLQKENEKQKELIKQLEDFIKTDGEIDHINHEYTYKLQKENEELKKKNKELLNLSNTGGALLVAESTKNKKYRQALEEIRKKITPVCAYCDNIDGFTTWDDCENVCEKGVIKYLKIIDEVLNDNRN